MHGGPRLVRRLPERVPLSTCLDESGIVALGVAEGDLRTVGFRPDRGQRRILVVGPPGSGRTTALATLAWGLYAAGRPVLVVGDSLAGHLESLDSGGGPGERGRGADRLVIDSVAHPHDPDGLDRAIAARRTHPRLAVIVDDGERLLGTPWAPVLREMVRLVDEDDGWFAVATTAAMVEGHAAGFVTDVGHAGTGLLLQPRPGSHLLGVMVPTHAPSRPDPPGRGWLVADRSGHRVQVAEPGGVVRDPGGAMTDPDGPVTS